MQQDIASGVITNAAILLKAMLHAKLHLFCACFKQDAQAECSSCDVVYITKLYASEDNTDIAIHSYG